MKPPEQQEEDQRSYDLDNEAIGCMAVVLIVGVLSILAGIYIAPI